MLVSIIYMIQGDDMIRIIEINSVEEISRLILEKTYNKEINRLRSSYYYRGMPDSSFKLMTSLARNCKHLSFSLEDNLLENFIKYVKLEEPTIDESIWKAMIMGQHYGLPTRLLDWTHSPLVALHFANNEENFEKLSSRDSVVWKIDINELNRHLPEKYRSALEQKRSSVFSIETLSEVVSSIDEYDNDMGDRAMASIEPPSIDHRIANQYSFFSIIPKGITDIEDYIDKNTDSTVKFIINKKIRWDIRDILDSYNMSERMMLPGKAGIAKWLARHYFVKD